MYFYYKLNTYYIILYYKYIFILDVLSLKYNDKNVPLLRTGIAWPSDKNIKYQNPPGPLQKGIQLLLD